MFKKIFSIFLAVLALLAALAFTSCARQYDVRFELNGGSLPKEDGNSYHIGDEYILPTPTKSGHEFDGWYLTEDFSGDPVVSIILGESEAVTLYAKFVRLIKITYQTEGGVTSNPTLVRQDEIVELSGAVLDGMIFEGWYTESEYKNRIKSLICPTRDLTLYAKYYGRYSITYDLCGGKNHHLNPDYYDSDRGALLFDPERPGYEFLGWYNDATDERFSHLPVGNKGDLRLVAKWKPIAYSIEWELNGGSVDIKLDKSYVYGVGLGDAPLPEATREGSIFLGWYNVIGEGEELIEAIDGETKGDLILEARFYTNDKRVVTELFPLNVSTKEVEGTQISQNGYLIEIPEELRPFADAGILGININACFTVGLRTQGNGTATLSVSFFADGEGHFLCSETVKGGGYAEYGSWSYSMSSTYHSITVRGGGVYVGYGYYFSSNRESADAVSDLIAICDSVSYSFYLIK